jgi:DNA-binding response OmpR family regulator
MKPSVLVVAPTPSIATTLFAWLADAGCAPLVVSSFGAAKQYLEDAPAVLISEVRLGEYNGLHLALKARAQGVPAIVLGQPDSVLQREAADLGAAYLAQPLDAQQLLAIVQPMLEARTEARQVVHPGRASVSFVSIAPRIRPTAKYSNPFRS